MLWVTEVEDLFLVLFSCQACDHYQHDRGPGMVMNWYLHKMPGKNASSRLVRDAFNHSIPGQVRSGPVLTQFTPHWQLLSTEPQLQCSL